MSIAEPFIRRSIATTLLTLALALSGVLAWLWVLGGLERAPQTPRAPRPGGAVALGEREIDIPGLRTDLPTPGGWNEHR